MNYVAITLPEILDVKNVIKDEILITAAGTNEEMWAKMGIAFKTGIENEYTEHIYEGNYRGAAPKYHGSKLSNTLGETLPRRLQVKPIWNRIPDSLDNYFEKHPISMLKLNDEGVTGEHTQFQLLRAAEQTSSQVRQNFFLGRRPATKALYDAITDDEEKEYALYDGIFVKIENMIAGKEVDGDQDANGNPLISEEKGNLISTAPIIGAPSAIEAYQEVVNFYNKLDSHLTTNETVYFYVCERIWQLVKQGYNLMYHGMQTPDVNKADFRFTDLPNVEFRHHAAFGYGDCIIATLNDNLMYGTDIQNDGEPNNAFVNIMQDPDDAHDIIIQIDVRSGSMILDPTKGAFATNGAKNYPSVKSWEAAQEDVEP